MKKKISLRELAMITVAMFVVSVAVYFFMIPSKVVVGSISGVAMVIAQVIPIPISILTFLLNVILLTIGFLFIGKEFGAKTVYTSMLLPVFLWIFERVAPLEESVTGNLVFDLVAACYGCWGRWDRRFCFGSMLPLAVWTLLQS